MIRLCLFDLDDTLVSTSDLESFRGTANVRHQDPGYLTRLGQAYIAVPGRLLYKNVQHQALRRAMPRMKWGVFTRSPRAYADYVLQRAYPDLTWDVVIAYEDVDRTKPYPDGVLKAMNVVGVTSPSEVVLVGDQKSDVVAAYRAGAWAVVDQSSWGARPWSPSCYQTLELVPDAILQDPGELHYVLQGVTSHLPDLERRSAGHVLEEEARPRFDTLNYAYPGVRNWYQPVAVLGKMFSRYQSLRPRAQFHELTQQILAHKDSVRFPECWIDSLRSYLGFVLALRNASGETVLTVVPKKPNGVPRMESLLVQLARSLDESPIPNLRVRFRPDLLSFDEGVESAHGRHLSAEQRRANVEAHLHVAQPDAVRGQRVLIIDDVITTGASLLWSSRLLTAAGATQVKCLALAKAVGEG